MKANLDIAAYARELINKIRKNIVKGSQGVYRKISSPTTPSIYPLHRPDYIFKQLIVEDIPAVTEDDFTLVITHKRPREINEDLVPIFLLPGLGETRFVLDQALGNSFVDYLALNGFDVYMGELRGNGKSSHSRERFDWNLDTFLRFDIPAMIHKIKERSGKKKIMWVGHSMGGMLLYAYLIEASLHNNSELFEEGLVHGGVTIGSPVSFDQVGLLAYALAYKFSFLSKLPYLPTDFLANALATFGVLLDTPLTFSMWNYNNIERKNKILYLKDGIDDISQGVMEDFVKYILSGDFTSSDGKINYRQNLYMIDVPLLIVGGAGDYLATQETCETVYKDVGSKDKTLRIFGKKGKLAKPDGLQVEMNDQIDYGHVDLTLGVHSKEEVWPYMLSWIRSRAYVGRSLESEEEMNWRKGVSELKSKDEKSGYFLAE